MPVHPRASVKLQQISVHVKVVGGFSVRSGPQSWHFVLPQTLVLSPLTSLKNSHDFGLVRNAANQEGQANHFPLYPSFLIIPVLFPSHTLLLKYYHQGRGH